MGSTQDVNSTRQHHFVILIMHFIQTLGVAIMAIAATSANPLPEAEAEPNSILPSLWCKKWDSGKNCCMDDDKPGCTSYSMGSKKCMKHKDHYWCNSWDSGKGCCVDKGKEGCSAWNYDEKKCEKTKEKWWCNSWDYGKKCCNDKEDNKKNCVKYDYWKKECKEKKKDH